MGTNIENDRVWNGDNCNNMTTNNLSDEQRPQYDLPSRKGELRRGRPLGGELPPRDGSSRQPPPRPHLVADPFKVPRQDGAIKSIPVSNRFQCKKPIISFSPHFDTLRAVSAIKKTRISKCWCIDLLFLRFPPVLQGEEGGPVRGGPVRGGGGAVGAPEAPSLVAGLDVLQGVPVSVWSLHSE